MTTVAVTGLHAGENPQPGYGVSRSLRRRYPGITIVGLAYDVLESGIYADDAPDVVYQIPYPSAGMEALLNRWDHIRAQHPIDVFIPTLDVEIQPMLRMQEAFARRGTRMMLPTLESFDARNKTKLPQLARACECQTPRSVSVGDASALLEAAASFTYPMMVKGQYYEAYKVHTQGALIEKFNVVEARWGAPVLVQQCIEGPEFCFIAVGDGDGGVAGCCAIRKTIISDKGKGYGAIVIRDETLNRLALRLLEHLRWLGPVELEFMKDEVTGDYYLLEINPRFPAWVDFPSTFGQNLPAVVVEKLLTGRWERLPPYPTGKFFLRHCVDLTCDIHDMGQLSTLGELRRKKEHTNE